MQTNAHDTLTIWGTEIKQRLYGKMVYSLKLPLLIAGPSHLMNTELQCQYQISPIILHACANQVCRSHITFVSG